MLFSSVEDPEIDEDIHERLKYILESLPEKQREVLLLHVVEKKKVREIAEQMDIAETTVKTHFQRALAILRNNLKSYCSEYKSPTSLPTKVVPFCCNTIPFSAKRSALLCPPGIQSETNPKASATSASCRVHRP